MELDHVFIATTSGAPAADRLRGFGLKEGSSNRHPGQGTANRRFFFHNAMLELLWIKSEAEARAGQAARLALADRCSAADPLVSPFGVCFRPSPGDALPHFPTWSYRPSYLPETMSIEVADGSPPSEPLWFFIGFSSRPDTAGRREPLDHGVGFREITAVRVTCIGGGELSESARRIGEEGCVAVAAGEAHLMELCFDGEHSGRRRDFRPDLPLVLRW